MTSSGHFNLWMKFAQQKCTKLIQLVVNHSIIFIFLSYKNRDHVNHAIQVTIRSLVLYTPLCRNLRNSNINFDTNIYSSHQDFKLRKFHALSLISFLCIFILNLSYKQMRDTHNLYNNFFFQVHTNTGRNSHSKQQLGHTFLICIYVPTVERDQENPYKLGYSEGCVRQNMVKIYKVWVPCLISKSGAVNSRPSNNQEARQQFSSQGIFDLG